MKNYTEVATEVVTANRAGLLLEIHCFRVSGGLDMNVWGSLLRRLADSAKAYKELGLEVPASWAELRKGHRGLTSTRHGVAKSHREWDMMDSKTRDRVKKDLDELSPRE